VYIIMASVRTPAAQRRAAVMSSSAVYGLAVFSFKRVMLQLFSYMAVFSESLANATSLLRWSLLTEHGDRKSGYRQVRITGMP